jgi:hypothetical protein
MPLGNQSLQPWTPTIYTSMVASTYKANIDGNSSVGGNPCGMLYVYPNSPAALNVLVDQAFNLGGSGNANPFLLNGAASPITVALTAPGSNSYYGTIYWDLTTNTAGVVYGATGVSPTPILPDQAWRIPIALVLLTAGQATVAASNIYDVRDIFTFCPLTFLNSAVSTTTLTVNCQGATSMSIDIGFTGAGLTLTLSNLQAGVPICMLIKNSNAGTQTFKMVATTPGGVAYSINAKFAAIVDMVAVGASMTTTLTSIYNGNSVSTPFLFLAAS